jgi:hypothetical protein
MLTDVLAGGNKCQLQSYHKRKTKTDRNETVKNKIIIIIKVKENFKVRLKIKVKFNLEYVISSQKGNRGIALLFL